MLTFIVRAFLFLVMTGILTLAFQHLYVTFRDGRHSRRLLEAHFYAQLVVMDRVMKGELNRDSYADMQEAYEFEKIAFLNR